MSLEKSRAGLFTIAGLVAANALLGLDAPQWLQWSIVALCIAIGLMPQKWLTTKARRWALLAVGMVAIVVIVLVVRPVRQQDEKAIAVQGEKAMAVQEEKATAVHTPSVREGIRIVGLLPEKSVFPAPFEIQTERELRDTTRQRLY